MYLRGGYLAALRRSWPLLVVMMILGAGAGAAIVRITPATYVATVGFYVSTPKTEGANPQSTDQFARSRVSSYVELLTSEQLARLVVDTTRTDLTPAQVSREIRASAPANTVTLNATVTDTSADRSLLIAHGIADNFGKLVDELDNAGRADAIVVISVISEPALDSQPTAPDPALWIGGGTVIGLLIGLAITVVRRLADTSLRTSKAAEQLLGAPIIGKIAYSRQARRSPLTIGEEPSSVRIESYRLLRVNLQHTAGSAKVILMTSAIAHEGTTTTAANLALAFLELGERVLLIDANLRRPASADLLELPREPGLSNVLAGQVALARAIRRWGTSRLALLASGSIPPNPSKLLSSARMSDLMVSLRRSYDKIIIDTPPVLPVTDALIVSSQADAVLLLVTHGRTRRSHAAAAANALRRVDALLIGLVFSMRRTRRAERRRYGEAALISAPILSESTPGTAPAPAVQNAQQSARATTAHAPAEKHADNGASADAGNPGTSPNGQAPNNRQLSARCDHAAAPDTSHVPSNSNGGVASAGHADAEASQD
jgi:capsular exopolysaccharide synthesis family protein